MRDISAHDVSPMVDLRYKKKAILYNIDLDTRGRWSKPHGQGKRWEVQQLNQQEEPKI